MTDIIRVDHEALTKIAANFGKESSAIAQMLQQVTQAMQKLQNGGWMGRGSDAFFAEMEQKVIPAVRRLIEALAEADRTTKTISTMMKSADEEASSGLREDVTNSSGGVGAGNATGGAGSGSSLGAVGGGAAIGGSGSGVGSSSGGATAGESGVGPAVGSGGTAPGVGGGGSTFANEGVLSDNAFGESGAGSGVGDSGGRFTTDMGMGSGYGDSFTTDMGMGSGDYGAGAGLYDGGLGMAADDINHLLDSGSALWGDDGLLTGDGAYGDTLDSNFFPGDYAGSDYLSDSYSDGYLGNTPYGFDAVTDYGIPSDWLDGVNDSLHDYLQNNYDDYGIPKDWLTDVHDGILADLEGDALRDNDLRSSDSGSGGGSSGGGSGSGSMGGGDTPLSETAPPSESNLGSGSGGGTGGGSGGGMPSTMPGSGLGSGSMGGGSGGMPNSFDRMPSELLGGGQGDALSQSMQAAPAPIRFAYQALGGSSGEQSARAFTSFGAGGGGVLPAAAPAQANMGLPISLAAVSPFLALLGKSLKRKTTDR